MRAGVCAWNRTSCERVWHARNSSGSMHKHACQVASLQPPWMVWCQVPTDERPAAISHQRAAAAGERQPLPWQPSEKESEEQCSQLWAGTSPTHSLDTEMGQKYGVCWDGETGYGTGHLCRMKLTRTSLEIWNLVMTLDVINTERHAAAIEIHSTGHSGTC